MLFLASLQPKDGLSSTLVSPTHNRGRRGGGGTVSCGMFVHLLFDPLNSTILVFSRDVGSRYKIQENQTKASREGSVQWKLVMLLADDDCLLCYKSSPGWCAPTGCGLVSCQGLLWRKSGSIQMRIRHICSSESLAPLQRQADHAWWDAAATVGDAVWWSEVSD